ncbi:cistern family PEP-CTERM protein [Ideonella sp. DXS22W]|uniref:Cistern family PEP-CTERM protein n=1 Tax=Pseudaquabacterium inlustre TaxID=2984192 RepID=A0ABU9CIB5_9BURK
MTSLRGWVVAAAALAGSAQAADLNFASVSSSGTLLFQTVRDGATLNASANFVLTALTATSATFNVTIANNSSGPGQNTLTALGIDVVSPTLTGVTDTSGTWDSVLNDTLPTLKRVDLCVYTSNGCSGGDIGDGMAEGGSSSFRMTLTTAGNFTTNGVTFTSPYGAKFQGVGNTGKSYEFAGCISGTTGCGGGGGGGQNQVPEPGSVFLAGLALLGMGTATAMRRRPRAA